MAKKKQPRSKNVESNPQAKPDEVTVDDDPQVQSASAALRRAQEELRRAEQHYKTARDQAAEKIEEIRDTTVGELVDGAMNVVRKHPAPCLLAAVAAGFLLDRLLRR